MSSQENTARVARILARATSPEPNEAHVALHSAYKRMRRDGVEISDLLALPLTYLYQEALVKLVVLVLENQGDISPSDRKKSFEHFMSLITDRFSRSDMDEHENTKPNPKQADNFQQNHAEKTRREAEIKRQAAAQQRQEKFQQEQEHRQAEKQRQAEAQQRQEKFQQEQEHRQAEKQRQAEAQQRQDHERRTASAQAEMHSQTIEPLHAFEEDHFTGAGDGTLNSVESTRTRKFKPLFKFSVFGVILVLVAALSSNKEFTNAVVLISKSVSHFLNKLVTTSFSHQKFIL